MEFYRVEANEAVDVIRHLSTNSLWEFGIRRVLYGYRVCLIKVGGSSYSFDYCASSKELFLPMLFITLKIYLEKISEDVREVELESRMPQWEIRPIIYDRCWEELQMMAFEKVLWPMEVLRSKK